MLTSTTITVGGKSYIIGPDGLASDATDGWVQKGGTWYYAKDGVLASGLQTISGKQYYFYSDSRALMVNDVVIVGDKGYKADGSGVLTVLPEVTQYLAIEEGRDFCTLVTCTPYGVNTHRLLVRGKRIETKKGTMMRFSADALLVDPLVVMPFLAAPILLLIFLLLMLRPSPSKKRKKQLEALRSMR